MFSIIRHPAPSPLSSSNDDNGFYITLLSNGCMGKYPNNTQASFTNALPRSLQLSENYVVGITEISLNPYQLDDSSSSLSRLTDGLSATKRKRSIYCCCDKNSEINEEVFSRKTPVEKKKKPRKEYSRKKKITIDNDDKYRNLETFDDSIEYINPHKSERIIPLADIWQVNIKVSDKYHITIFEYNIIDDNVCYNLVKRDMYLGKLLQKLTSYLYLQKGDEDYDKAKRVVKQRILDVIDNIRWDRLPVEKLKPSPKDFFIHIFLKGQRVSVNLLKHQKYDSLEEFFKFLLKQVPYDKRDGIALKNVINDNFYKEYDAFNDEEYRAQYGLTYPKLVIILSELGIQVRIPYEQISKKLNAVNTISFLDFMLLLKDNIIYQKVDASEVEKQEKRDQLYDNLVHSLQEYKIDTPIEYGPGGGIRTNSHDFYLQLPNNATDQEGTFSSRRGIQVKDYKNFNDLIAQIFKYIYPKFRAPNKLIDIVNQLRSKIIDTQEEKQENKNDSQPVALSGSSVPKESENDLQPKPTSDTESKNIKIDSSVEAIRKTENDQAKKMPTSTTVQQIDQPEIRNLHGQQESKVEQQQPTSESSDGRTSLHAQTQSDILSMQQPQPSQSSIPDKEISVEPSTTPQNLASHQSPLAHPHQPKNHQQGQTEVGRALEAPDIIPANHIHYPSDFTYIPSAQQQQQQIDTEKIKCRHIFVYTDIIRPRAIADTSSRLLRVILDSNLHIQFNHIEYNPLEKSYIESISILLTDNNGNKINFNNSLTPILITLHFKLKNI